MLRLRKKVDIVYLAGMYDDIVRPLHRKVINNNDIKNLRMLWVGQNDQIYGGEPKIDSRIKIHEGAAHKIYLVGHGAVGGNFIASHPYEGHEGLFFLNKIAAFLKKTYGKPAIISKQGELPNEKENYPHINMVTCHAAEPSPEGDYSTSTAYQLAKECININFPVRITARTGTLEINDSIFFGVYKRVIGKQKEESKLTFFTTPDKKIEVFNAYTKKWLYTYDSSSDELLASHENATPDEIFKKSIFLLKEDISTWRGFTEIDEKLQKLPLEGKKHQALLLAKNNIIKALDSPEISEELWLALNLNPNFFDAEVKKNTGFSRFFGIDCGTVSTWENFVKHFKKDFPEIYQFLKENHSASQIEENSYGPPI